MGLIVAVVGVLTLASGAGADVVLNFGTAGGSGFSLTTGGVLSFNPGFILRVSDSGGDDSHPVMIGNIFQIPGDTGFIPTRLCYTALEIIRYASLWDPAKIEQGIFNAVKKIFVLLRQHE